MTLVYIPGEYSEPNQTSLAELFTIFFEKAPFWMFDWGSTEYAWGNTPLYFFLFELRSSLNDWAYKWRMFLGPRQTYSMELYGKNS